MADPDTELAVPFSTGFLLKGRYLVEGELGRGGFGVVFRALDQQLMSRPVVIKVLLENSYRDEYIKTKFRQEMEALARIDHPGIVSILDSGELPDGRMFLVLQYIQGVSLRSLIPPEGMDLPRASLLCRRIAEALSAAHRNGVLHRDLKPENIMVQSSAPEEQVKVIDFGLAKVFQSRIAESTAIPNVAGSFAYISPEQLTARPVTPASDIYSLGVIAYEMFTGRRPHNPESMFELLEMMRAGVQVLPRGLRSSIPPDTQKAILKALSFEPSDRYQDAAEFADDLGNSTATARSTKLDAAISNVPVNKGAQGTSWPATLAAVFVATGLWFVHVSVLLFEPWFVFALVASVIGACAIACVRMTRAIPVAAAATMLLLAGIFCYFSYRVPPPVRGSLIPDDGTIDRYTLNYSDPRGYRYTMQQDSYFRVDLDPGRWNRLHDFSLKITLTPEVEFAEIYLDRQFKFAEQLTLESSSTNDIFVLRRENDTFAGTRSILFRCKSRNPPQAIRWNVTLESAGKSYSYEF